MSLGGASDSATSGFGRARYLRLLWTLARYCLIREMTFRANFLARVAASAGWIVLMVFYFQLIYGNTTSIGGWSRDEFFFLMGTYFLIGATVDTIFLEGCARFSELIRTGNLDFVLTKPVDEQFLLSFERIDWAEAPTAALGLGLVAYSCVVRGIEPTFGLVAGYFLLAAAGVAMLYSFMLMISSLSVWLVRSQWFLELWFMVMLFARYPAEIYRGSVLASAVRITLTFVIPVLLAINVPARFGAKLVEWPSALGLLGAALLLLLMSRRFFFFALSRYRSASS